MSIPLVCIIDYGVGNLGSIRNMFAKVGVAAEVSSGADSIASATHLVLPGVGAFDKAMEHLHASGLIAPLEQAVTEGKPMLAICLGMQLITRGSEEGTVPGLGWVDADSHRFVPEDSRTKVPHMGWARVDASEASPMFAGMQDPRFYFLHSYYVSCDNPSESAATTEYAGVTFDCALSKGSIWGAQFHPEKSHRFGMQLFRNFAAR